VFEEPGVDDGCSCVAIAGTELEEMAVIDAIFGAGLKMPPTTIIDPTTRATTVWIAELKKLIMF